MPNEIDFNSVFSENLRHFMSVKKISQRKFCELMDVSVAAVNAWVHGQSTPRMDRLDRMCEIFHCSREDLLLKHEEGYYVDKLTADMAQAIYEDETLRALFDAAKQLSPEQLTMAKNILIAMKGTNDEA